MKHFKYINPIRRPNGSLRTIEEYEEIIRLENIITGPGNQGVNQAINRKHEIIENEKRSSI